ncbi:hypothetical protein LCGC14_1354450, partial [marine sediment metagenome]
VKYIAILNIIKSIKELIKSIKEENVK